MTSSLSNKPYSFEEINEILQVMQTINSSIPPNATELEKFMVVYKAIGISADYDRTGCEGNENSTSERVNLTRSLKGVLLEGRAVCSRICFST